ITPTATGTPSALYTANEGSNNVSVILLDGDGNPAGPMTGSPFGAGLGPGEIALHPGMTRLYVGNMLANSLTGFTPDPPTGNSTGQQAGSPFAAGISPLGLTVHPNGTHLYVLNQGAQSVNVFLLDASGNVTGQQTGSPFGGAGPSPSGSALNPVTRSRLY